MRRNRGRKWGILLLTVILLVITGYLIANSTPVKKMYYPMKYKEYVFQYAGANHVDPYLIFAIIKAESGFDPNATSGKSARGLMQIMDTTGKEVAGKLKIQDFNCNQLYDPETNIRIGCWHVSRLMKEFSNDADLVVAAYNSGSRNVKDWLKNKKYNPTGSRLETIPFKETSRFLSRVKKYCTEYKKLYEK